MANRKLNSIKFPDIADAYILDAGKVEYHETDTFEEDTVGKALQNKANIDGSYDSMTVGNAEQLVSNVRVNDKTPYLFRTSGGSVDIGDREYVNAIVGGTVAWNQLVPNNYSKSEDSLTSFSSGTTFVAGHKYFLSRKLSASENVINAVFCRVSGVNQNSLHIDGTKTATIKQALFSGTSAGNTTTTEGNAWIYQGNNSNVVTVTDFNIIDLTQMFGSTIADYIYSLEQANAGAGVAWFRKLFPKPYYAYNAGELKSVSGLVSHDMTGFNQWDEEWEVGAITASGNYPSTKNIRGKNYIPCIGGATYFSKCSAQIVVFQYDADKTLIRPSAESPHITVNANRTFTTLIDARYMRFYTQPAYGTTYNHDICINISWDGSRDGEYEPYEKHSYPLDSDLTLRGIPKLDANNNLYYDGDTYEADGTVTRKYGIVDLGTLTWTKTTTVVEGENRFLSDGIATVDARPTSNGVKANIICSKYEVKTADEVYNATLGVCINALNGNVIIYDHTYTDSTAAQFKTAMSGVYLVYELATPTTETADPYQQTQIVNDFGTEEYVISDNTFAVPVGSDTDYPVNLVAKLEMAPNSPDGSGDYIVRQTNGVNEYVPLVIEDALPQIPSTAGSYKLTVTVTEGSDPVLSWESE